jgi:hypothetical protein
MSMLQPSAFASPRRKYSCAATRGELPSSIDGAIPGTLRFQTANAIPRSLGR